MLCLGIESSCDETALALVEDGRLVEAVLASQADVHALFGGVVPELASREHYRFVGALFDELMQRSGRANAEIDLIAAARGPGLLGSLLVGVAFAKGLALGLGKPFLGVNHLHAHLLAVGLEHELRFPALGLLVSGGHTHLYRMESPWDCRLFGRTLDDAAGEAFDKIARTLGLGYPGGPAIDKAAMKGNPDFVQFPRAYLEEDSYDFSFSGLKSAVLNYLNGMKMKNLGYKVEDIAASFQMAVVEVLTEKTIKAAVDFKVDRVCLSGGVACNSLLRKMMKDKCQAKGILLDYPQPKLCTDNGAMIASAGYYKYVKGDFAPENLTAMPNLKIGG